MKKFLKDLCGKVTLSALDFYKQKKLHQVRCKAAAVFGKTVKCIGNGVLGYFGFIFLASLLAGGLVLAPFAWVAHVFQQELSGDVDSALAVRNALGRCTPLLITCASVYILVPLMLATLATREFMMRKFAGADKIEKTIRGD